ncbi:MAG: hypothetical protein ACYTEN_04575 [Planctomycetota bacterium]
MASRKDIAKESIFDKLIICYRRIKVKVPGKILRKISNEDA